MKGIFVGTSTHPTHHFIDNHKNTIPIADFPDTLNIPLRRRDTSQCRSNNRLKNKSYYFLWTNFLNHIHQLSYQGFRVFVLSRSEEHTSELQSQSNLVCRLLLEKKKNNI